MSFRCLGNERCGYDVQMEGTQRRNEGVLHCWPGQLYRVGRDDSDWADQNRRHYCWKLKLCQGVCEQWPELTIGVSSLQNT